MSEEEIFRGYSIPRNKELMRIYKDLDFVEQLGSGIPRIIAHYGKECFEFSPNFLRIVLPASEQVNPYVAEQATEQATEQVTEQVQQLIQKLDNEKYSTMELMNKLGLKHRPSFLYSYLKPAMKLKMVQMTIPEKPRSSKQKYHLTQKGKRVLQKLKKKERE